MVNIIIYAFILAGTFFILVAAIGLVRFRDLYSRLHAGTKAPSFGIFLLLVGVSIYFNTAEVYIKSLFIVLFIYITAPLAAHAIVKSFKEKDDDPEAGSPDYND